MQSEGLFALVSDAAGLLPDVIYSDISMAYPDGIEDAPGTGRHIRAARIILLRCIEIRGSMNAIWHSV